MESEVFTPLLEQFMLTPLVTWVKTFGQLGEKDGGKLSEYIELVDGIYLNEIMLQINPKASVQRTNKNVNNDSTLRIQNLTILIRQIKSYYQETLQQFIMMPLPNVLTLGRNPLCEQGLEEIKKLLLLLLGCAVQCEEKEEYIDRIQTLDFHTKAVIASHIQEVTHNQENVLDLQWVEVEDLAPEDLESLSRNMAFHLKRLVDERDEQLEKIVELTQERDCGQYYPPAPCTQSPNGSPSMHRTESRQHLSVELADAKAKIRRLRQELEEKSEQLMDCRQELENLEAELKRIQQENMQLLADARSARAYRDELDALREKAIRVDKLESEVGRYKEKLHDIEFYRARVEELKEDNQVLLETKNMLEDQLEGSRARSDKLHELEKENLQLKAKIHDMEMDRDVDRKRIEELLEENLSLEMAQKQSMDESLHLGWELEQLSKTPEHTDVLPQKSLRHEVNELTSSQLLKLEKENQTLQRTVEELGGGGEPSERTHTRLLKAEKENQRLAEKLKQLDSEMSADRQSLQSAESLKSDLMREKGQLEKTLETLRDMSERQVKVLEQENERLTQTVATLRQRSQISVEARVRDVEKENRALHESVKESGARLSKAEFERAQLRKDLEAQREKADRAEELEAQVQRLERENEALQKRAATLGLTCDRLEAVERENAEREVETRGLRKKLDALRAAELQLEALEKENAQLEEENLELRRSGEAQRAAGSRAAQLEQENRELEEERAQLRKSLELLRASSRKTERLEASCQGLDTENQRLQKALESGGRKIQQLEDELQEVEAENQGLQRSLEELKVSSKRLEQLEKESRALEQETAQLERDKKQLEKENRRLRQQAEIRDATLDESHARLARLEQENRALGKEAAISRDSCGRVRDLEKDNKELLKQATIDKKTLLTLREELVNEKLTAQQMNNELEKLTHELEKIGLNKERLLQDEQSSDHRYQLLESKLESTLKKSLEIKEEKIAALEARLEESSNLNQQLRQELKTVKKNYEALQQREEEERMVQSSPLRAGEELQAASKWEKESREATRELLKVKDRLIEVERNNATLQAEKQALRTQLKQLETQSDNLQAQILVLQRQTASLQESNTTLQTQNAKLQVENSTLSSQSASLMAQNAQLQSQQCSAESEREGALREREDLRCAHELLLRDHEKLAALHERQAAEYEALIGKHGGLKAAHKSLELEHRELEDRYNQLLKQKDQLKQLERDLKAEQEKMLSESRDHKATTEQYHRLKEENDKLNTAHSQLLRDTEALQAEHRALKTQMNSGKLELTRLEAEFSRLKEQYQQLDITSTKLTNQCELLSQLKGNLEEENKHLLDQIQTLMLQNRTLLEQTMESKDLFHVEQRQYIDKLNELRRQKEKLEEKIMDQYKFYDPSPPRRALLSSVVVSPRRRGNWITLKMRKLMKPKSRMRSLPLSPPRSESTEAFLAPPDSQDSSSLGSGSASMDDSLSHKRSNMSALKRFPFMRSKPKEKDRNKTLFRRSMSMNDLLHTVALAGGHWASSSENLDRPEEGATRQRRKELGSLAFSTTAINYTSLHPPAGPSAKQSLRAKDDTSCEDVTPATVDNANGLRSPAAGAVNGSRSRPQSESSGEFSPSLENEAWSCGSSPAQRSARHSPQVPRRAPEPPAPQAPRKGPSLGGEVLSLQQFLQEPAEPGIGENPPAETLPLSCDSSPSTQRERAGLPSGGRGILRSASGRAGTADSSPRSGPASRPSLRKAESTRVRGSAPRPSLATQGKATSVSERLNSAGSASRGGSAASGSALPRASSVISTAEGSSRRTSIHDFMAKDTRAPVSIDPSPAKATPATKATPSEYPAPTPAPPALAYETLLEEEPPKTSAPNLGSFLGSSFTIDSVFMDTIFSDPPYPGAGKSHTFLSLNPSLVCNISGPPPKHAAWPAQTGQEAHGKPGPPQPNGQPPEHSAGGDITDPGQVTAELPALSSEDKQSLWFEYGCV
ncbi:girdin-like isoform X3 [Anguilla rostrata]|uniref:girdin-like isoform X3 n=1 Tax=Anguilla rostrata TaxID=7938 RepID=UPI0030D123EC